MSDAIERIELKIAFLENANTELSDVVYRQQQELIALRERLGMLSNRFDDLESKPPDWSAADEKPPHY
ncbi:MAG: SlyX family protein [Candidatus Obscuribacterales bacterium]|nr:SlyX family protein [Steroidobacteraceae bacterium]